MLAFFSSFRGLTRFGEKTRSASTMTKFLFPHFFPKKKTGRETCVSLPRCVTFITEKNSNHQVRTGSFFFFTKKEVGTEANATGNENKSLFLLSSSFLRRRIAPRLPTFQGTGNDTPG